MTEHVWIFGDSFAERWVDIEVNGKLAWPILMEDFYKVENFGKCGSGPEYQLNLLTKKINNIENLDDLKNINLIFILSHSARINFSFLEPGDQWLSGRLTSIEQPSWKDLTHDIQEKIQKYKKHVEFVTNFYDFFYFYNNHETEFYKRISLLKDLSYMFKKVAVIPVFDNIEEFSLYQLLKENKNQENFHIAKGIGIGWYASTDPTDPNHFVERNHVEFFQMIKKWIDKNINIDTKKLTKFT